LRYVTNLSHHNAVMQA